VWELATTECIKHQPLKIEVHFDVAYTVGSEIVLWHFAEVVALGPTHYHTY